MPISTETGAAGSAGSAGSAAGSAGAGWGGAYLVCTTGRPRGVLGVTLVLLLRRHGQSRSQEPGARKPGWLGAWEAWGLGIGRRCLGSRACSRRQVAETAAGCAIRVWSTDSVSEFSVSRRLSSSPSFDVCSNACASVCASAPPSDRRADRSLVFSSPKANPPW